MTAYELALLWDAWLSHQDDSEDCEGDELPGCWCSPGGCEQFNAACSANAAVLEDQKAYTDEALRQQGQWSGGKRDA